MIRRPPRSPLFPSPTLFRSDVVRATRGAKPTHAMRQTRRGEPHLRITKTLADPPQDLAFVHPQSVEDRKSTRLNSSHLVISYAVFCLKKKKRIESATHPLCT